MLHKIAAVLSAPVACTITVGCSGDAPASNSAADQGTSTTPATAGQSKGPERTASSSPTAKPEETPKGYATRDAYIVVAVRDGKVLLGKSTFKVKLDDQVIMKVLADSADELHLHGYDLSKKLEPGKPVTLSFKADIPGQFEAELHHLHLQLFTLQVQ